MPWFKVDDGLAFHAKTVAAGNTAMGLWVRAGAWCAQQLTDGFVPEHMVATLGGKAVDARKLVEAGLWATTDGGYAFWQWSERQPSREKVEQLRNEATERQQRAREASKSRRDLSRQRPPVTHMSQRDNSVTDALVTDMSQRDNSVSHTLVTALSQSPRPDPTRPVLPTEELTPPTTTLLGPPVKITKGTRVPDTWPATDALRTWITEHAPAVDGTRETAQWLDYHRAKGDTAKDWAASWRTWMRRAQTDSERRPASYTRPAGNRPSTPTPQSAKPSPSPNA